MNFVCPVLTEVEQDFNRVRGVTEKQSSSSSHSKKRSRENSSNVKVSKARISKRNKRNVGPHKDPATEPVSGINIAHQGEHSEW